MPNLQAGDPAAGRVFYADVLGLEPVMDLGWIVTDEAWGVRRFFVREPGGRVLNILSHR